MIFSYYFIVTLILILVWALIFATKQELRKEMIILGVLSLFLLPLAFTIQTSDEREIQHLFSSLSIMDLIFSFGISGIAGVIFHVFFGKHYHLMPIIKSAKKENELATWWVLRLFFSILFFVWITLFLALGFDLSSASAMLISAIMISIYIISHRNNLLIDSILSGVLTAMIVFLIVSLAGIFSQAPIDISFINVETYFAGVPVELLLWSLALGIVLGPLYEYTRRIELK
ncbi:hypothetical protein CO057_00635 [Candidatus Uhrbacteria bacterium CG_4_9_14_0_2_um_filter_41_50]|uniref:Lycopene cyclase domain-containing protein n=1 Tax=Candidatus Uhrbacteria bacterium CG_4_9_14_0_2_um_filter_41_50 TaxID=1975031 RepID=A0A2M8EQ27_9BACT|nr:MAG: hypothetical protein COZ45_02040 [Candidatus Uhrbacteria bacterium CG_4_10_14_3_um_filter_41_21]PIZ54668.1 MAG: hypothetical protein COY24_02980 [Candidatus Uhrbacteria bacterium CG_4_10_14_0_2_um_filter_41_21]PJB84738.1 MAG: hypothetical protein CO086_01955 [Candidatus Uhrbacteria bacterium CG_4_9_14_0_8_um_filter_41_16]PJC24840.1 MAG: hypothetical protein CO057_00635 [Candidatus Uhrbacteria bacterium CG_4_9_14_0_2_um_filter_41_50]PJE75240.1 MAG: hypothetical protein COV03_01225 [Candi